MFEMLLYISSLISNVPVVLYNIYMSYQNKTGHMRPFTEAIRPLIPIFIFFIITLVWILKSPSNLIETDPRALFFLMGTIFSNISVSFSNAIENNPRKKFLSLLANPCFILVPFNRRPNESYEVRRFQLTVNPNCSSCYRICRNTVGGFRTFPHVQFVFIHHIGSHTLRDLCGEYFRIV